MLSRIKEIRNKIFGVNQTHAVLRERNAALGAELLQVKKEVSDLKATLGVQLHENLNELRHQLSITQNTIGSIGDDLKRSTPKLTYESFDVEFLSRIEAGLSSARYFNKNLYSKPVFNSNMELFKYCISHLSKKLIFPLEFGVYSGNTINKIAECAGADTVVYGFDSFEGLPEDWRSDFKKGAFAREGLPKVSGNVVLKKGWFEDTIPIFVSEEKPEDINFIHIDCDLYSSTKTIFEGLSDYFSDTVVIVFDEYFNYPGWEFHEFKAFQEFIEGSDYEYEYLASVPKHQQVAVKIRRMRRGKV